MQAKNRDFSRLFRFFFVNSNYCSVKLGFYHQWPSWFHSESLQSFGAIIAINTPKNYLVNYWSGLWNPFISFYHTRLPILDRQPRKQYIEDMPFD